MTEKKTVARTFAIAGFAVTVAIYVSTMFTHYSEPASKANVLLGLVSIALCPPSLLSVPLFDIEPHSMPGVLLWAIIGLLNAAIYAAVGFVANKYLLKTALHR